MLCFVYILLRIRSVVLFMKMPAVEIHERNWPVTTQSGNKRLMSVCALSGKSQVQKLRKTKSRTPTMTVEWMKYSNIEYTKYIIIITHNVCLRKREKTKKFYGRYTQQRMHTCGKWFKRKIILRHVTVSFDAKIFFFVVVVVCLSVKVKCVRVL